MKSRVLITAALPYANGPLHFGHIAGAYLPADVYARFRRLLGDEVLYICGSDEYGIAITLYAEKEGIGYQEYVDRYHAMHKNLFKRLNISLDHFSRTTNPFHAALVQNFYTDLKKNGWIQQKASEHLYSEDEKKFLADRYVEGGCPKCGFDPARGDECPQCGADYEAIDLINPRSKLSGKPLIRKNTEHAFLCLDKMIIPLQKFIQKCYLRDHIRNFVIDYIDHVRPRAITRDLSWGIPVPDFLGKVFYVWFDAPIGYISGSMDWAASQGRPEAWKDFWLSSNTEYIQFVGKDNVPFHAVIFPAMELGQDQPYKKVDALISSEFYLLEGAQFSKSEGNYIDMDAFLNEHALDKLRYVLAATSPESSDSEFSLQGFKTRCNSELIGKFGNFINRVLSFAYKNGFHHLAYDEVQLEPSDLDFLRQAAQYVEAAKDSYRSYSLRKACSVIMELAALGNTYINDQAPWKLLKQGNFLRVRAILFAACMCQKMLALIAYPILPTSACSILAMLGARSLHSVHVDSEKAIGLWQDSFTNFEQESFSLQEPTLLFSAVE